MTVGRLSCMSTTSGHPLRVSLAGTWLALPSRGGGPADYNLALGYLQAQLCDRTDVCVERHDFPMHLGETTLPDGAADLLLSNDPHVIGLSSYCWDVDAFTAVSRTIKERSPDTLVLVGGPSATFGADRLLQNHPSIDLAVLGEGEQTLVELLDGGWRDPSRVRGVVWRDGDRVCSTGNRPRASLGSLRSPYLSGVLRPPQRQIVLEWSRGCVLRCRHCAWKNFLGGLRLASPQAIVSELRWALDLGYDSAFVLDAAVNFDDDWLDEVTRAVQAALPPDAFRFTYFLSQGHYHAAQRAALARLTSQEIWIGLESVQSNALRALGRPRFEPIAFERMLTDLSDLAPVHLSIILGIPGDTLDGFCRTLDFLAALPGHRVRIGSIRVFWMLAPPGSFFAEEHEKHGLRTVPGGLPYVLHSATFPEADLRKAFQLLSVHPRRDLFVYDDPLPGRWLPGLEDLCLRRESLQPSVPAQPHLPLATWAELIPGCESGGALLDGWRVRGVFLQEGWPSLRLEKAGACVTVQLRRRSANESHLMRAGRYALTWVRDQTPPHAELPRLMQLLATTVARRAP
jgi:radical SAM superfamily enzyme YgiQ (UPF0313 family)